MTAPDRHQTTAPPRESIPGGWTARRLDPARPYKPLDIGEAGVVTSVDAESCLISVSQGHPVHGMVRLAATAPFSADSYDAAAVREYRRDLSRRGAPGFGVRAPSRLRRTRRPAWLIEDAIPATSLGSEPASPAVATLVPLPEDAEGAHGVVQILLPGTGAQDLMWTGTVRLARASYTQLTEGGPLRPLRYGPTAVPGEGAVVVEDPGLGWAVALAGDLEEPRAIPGQGDVELRASVRAPGRLVVLGVGRDRTRALDSALRLAALEPDEALERAAATWRARWRGWPADLDVLDPVVRRGVAYALASCAVPVGTRLCLVTDHRILPLAWTRDAYYLTSALLAWWRRGGPREAVAAVRRHLDWLFEVAERPRGWWARSYLVGGQPKDLAFQLDQQLYPLLELAEYVEATGDGEPLDRHGPRIELALRALERRRAAVVSLYATEENPADDPMAMPYQTAGNVLVWRTFHRLHGVGVGGGRLQDAAEAVRGAVRKHQVVDGAGAAMFAYATDLAGGAVRYHDANDLPMSLAPAWGFCDAEDPVWRATMRFAFSPANPGFFAGRRGGLGSTHTPGAWSLGHVQARVVGAATGDGEMVARATSQLAEAALWDGALAEASDPDSGAPVSRPWFAWPGAALAANLL